MVVRVGRELSSRHIRLDFGSTSFDMQPTTLVKSIIEAHVNPLNMWIPTGIKAIVKDYYADGHVLKPIYFVVTEQPPAVRSVSVNGTRYSVSVPYLINVFTMKMLNTTPTSAFELNRIWAFSFYSVLPLRGWDSRLLLCNLPNVESNPWNENMKMATIGWTCFNNVPEELKYAYGMKDLDNRSESDTNVVANHAIKLVDYYLTSDFDLTSETSSSFHATAERIPEVSSFERWEEETLKDPQMAFGLDWLEHPEDATLRDVMGALREATHCINPRVRLDGDGTQILTPTGNVLKRRLLALLHNGSGGSKWF
jgi:hypothetical protein